MLQLDAFAERRIGRVFGGDQQMAVLGAGLRLQMKAALSQPCRQRTCGQGGQLSQGADAPGGQGLRQLIAGFQHGERQRRQGFRLASRRNGHRARQCRARRAGPRRRCGRRPRWPRSPTRATTGAGLRQSAAGCPAAARSRRHRAGAWRRTPLPAVRQWLRFEGRISRRSASTPQRQRAPAEGRGGAMRDGHRASLCRVTLRCRPRAHWQGTIQSAPGSCRSAARGGAPAG